MESALQPSSIALIWDNDEMDAQTLWLAKWRRVSTPMRHVILALIIAAGSGHSLAQSGRGDPVRGHRIAHLWCGDCHQVDASSSGRFVAPSFRDIARVPSTTALSLTVFLRTTHKNMPNFQVSGQEGDDIVAYILTLQRHLRRSP